MKDFGFLKKEETVKSPFEPEVNVGLELKLN